MLFDVMIDGLWLERHNVEDIARKLNVDVVPIIGQGTLFDAVDMVKSDYESRLRNTRRKVWLCARKPKCSIEEECVSFQK